jgi:hypothetical protein
MLRFYEGHNLASKSFLFSKETKLEIFFESVFGKSKCDCWCFSFLTGFCIFILKYYSDLNFILWICAVQEKDTEYKDSE